MKNITSLSADARCMAGISAMQRLWRVVVKDGRRRRRAKGEQTWRDTKGR